MPYIVDKHGIPVDEANRFPVDIGASSNNRVPVDIGGAVVNIAGDAIATPKYTDVVIISPNDSGTVSAGGFMVNTSGDIRILTEDATDVTLSVRSGDVYPIAISRVFSTGTTADGIVGLV